MTEALGLPGAALALLVAVGSLYAFTADAAERVRWAVGRKPAKEFDLQGFIDRAVRDGGRRIVVPPGSYRIRPRRARHLVLRDLRDVTIIADDVEMICTETTRALTIAHCRNVKLRGITIDYDPLPYSQGRIVSLSGDKHVHEIELFEGYPAADQVRNFKYEIFGRETRRLRTWTYGLEKIERLSERRLRLTRRGGNERDPERVGDIIAIGAAHAPNGSAAHAVECSGSAGVVLEDIRLYASNCFGFLEYNCDGTTYRRCRIDRRRPEDDLKRRGDPRIRSLAADAFHSKHADATGQTHQQRPEFARDGAWQKITIRKFDAAGKVRLAGYFKSGTKGDGTGGRILVDGREVHSSLQGGAANPERSEFDIVVDVRGGSLVDVAVTPGVGTDTGYDATSFAVRMTASGE